MRTYLWLFIGFLGFVAPAFTHESPGIQLESTRVIYPQGAKNGVNFTIINHTQLVYLLQSRVAPWMTLSEDLTEASPFIVLPPLVRFAPNDEITLRIKLTNNQLPKDRESIFKLQLKAIPSQPTRDNVSEDNDNKMVLALQNSLKLFYRPEGLPIMSIEDRSQALRIIEQDSKLTITNPSPYYITLAEVNIDERPLAIDGQRMIAPFSSATFHYSSLKAKTVSWKLIDDQGKISLLHTKNLY